jgi:hypothetical protein
MFNRKFVIALTLIILGLSLIGLGYTEDNDEGPVSWCFWNTDQRSSILGDPCWDKVSPEREESSGAPPNKRGGKRILSGNLFNVVADM